MVKNYWTWFCTLFLSTGDDSKFNESYQFLKKALKSRPDSITEFQTVFKTIGIKADMIDDGIELSADETKIDNANDGKRI